MTSTPLPPPPQTDKVQGTSLTWNDTVSPVSDYKEDVGRSKLYVLTDFSVCLDLVLIQLKELAPKWRELAMAVGAENVNEISDFVRKELKSLCSLAC